LTGYFRSAKLCLVSQAKEDKTFFGIVKRHSPKNKLIKNLNLIRWRSLLYMEGYRKKKKEKIYLARFAHYCIRKYFNRFMNVFKGFYYNKKEYKKNKKVYPHSLALITVYEKRKNRKPHPRSLRSL